MSIDDAISIISACRRYTTQSNYRAAYDVALEVLREKKEADKNEPITKEEIEKMNGEPIFFVPLKNKDAIPGWSIIRGDSITSRSESKPSLMYFFYLKNYGTDWIAYRHKKGPSHE